ncbi:hypothetical protein BOTNAR_0061g00060 [Botryotinia narcissicola]|uniref:Uncharacterized protein n=1 Tax=Botryotinia narcissicola TaxID=278944 RepID=A0A4Z1IYE3_9HELO|nr:hypothetical protein BOTNAR_0061g00060 [Botryotinia narcissicola]
MISTAPKIILLDIAKFLDDERAAGYIRGPLHGIPVTVKDSICTDFYYAAQDPVGTVPLGCSQTNGCPFGFTVVALANEEHKIL